MEIFPYEVSQSQMRDRADSVENRVDVTARGMSAQLAWPKAWFVEAGNSSEAVLDGLNRGGLFPAWRVLPPSGEPVVKCAGLKVGYTMGRDRLSVKHLPRTQCYRLTTWRPIGRSGRKTSDGSSSHLQR